MKLLLINGNTDQAITDRLAMLARAALPRLGLAAEIAAVTAPFGARYIATRAAAAVAGHAVLVALARALSAPAAQFDAVVIACFGDPGLEAARELCPLPVIGMAEASLQLADRLAAGGRIAVLTGGAAWVPMLEEFCLIRGLGPDRVLVRAIPPTGAQIAAAPEAAIAALAREAQAAAAAGAAAVVLGGAGLAGLAQRVAEAAGVPVLDSLDCALTAAAAAAPGPWRAPEPVASAGLDPALTRLMGGGFARV
ncbi:MAG: aspartate/glutamate racemase family protein [Rhodovarius sp.]|nr:aspartate/glutamate racemase family protein [Rhodovarius sp.]